MIDLTKKLEFTYTGIFDQNRVEVTEYKDSFTVEIFDGENYAYLEGNINFNEKKYTINEILINHKLGETLYFARILNESEKLARELKLKQLIISPYMKSEISLLNAKNFQLIDREAIKNL